MEQDIKTLDDKIKELKMQKQKIQAEQAIEKYAEKKTKEVRMMIHKIVPEGFTIEDTVNDFFDTVSSHFHKTNYSSDKGWELYELGELIDRKIKELSASFEERRGSEQKFLDALEKIRNKLKGKEK